MLDMIAAARAEGLDVDCDAYPYAAGANPLKNLLPPWVQVGGNAAMLGRLAEPQMRARIAQEIAESGLNNWGRIPSWDCVQVSISPNRPETAGKTVAALAAAAGTDPIDQLCDHLIADNGATRVLITSISEDDIRTIVRSPTALVGSDGNCVATYGTVSQGMPHPRFYGTFPRIIGRYVGEEQLLPLEAAIHKMTGATAKALEAARPRALRRRLARRCRDLRPRGFPRPRDLRRPAPLPERRAHHGHRQRRRGRRQRHAYRRDAGRRAAALAGWQRGIDNDLRASRPHAGETRRSNTLLDRRVHQIADPVEPGRVPRVGLDEIGQVAERHAANRVGPGIGGAGAAMAEGRGMRIEPEAADARSRCRANGARGRDASGCRSSPRRAGRR